MVGALALAGCASPHIAAQAGAAEPRQLSEAQGLVAVREALLQAGVLAERDFPVLLDGQPFDADVRFADPPFAIEWLSAEEHAREGARLPTSTPTSPLQIAACQSEGRSVQMLVLDAAAYVYEANPLLVQRGALGIDDAERRVRHDVADFLDYARDQGGRF